MDSKEEIKLNDEVLFPKYGSSWGKGTVVEIKDYKTFFSKKDKKIYRIQWVEHEIILNFVKIGWFGEDDVIKNNN